MLAIISPAKTLDFESKLATEKFTLPDFPKESLELIKTLRKFDPAGISNLMGISEKLAELNHERYQQWHVDADAESARPAILAFKGDVYMGLDAQSMQARDFTWAQKHLRRVVRPSRVTQAAGPNTTLPAGNGHSSCNRKRH